MKQENVLTFPREIFEAVGSFQGVNTDTAPYFRYLFDIKTNFFLNREEAESDANFKQIIPYIVFKEGDKYLSYRRGKSSGEQRLASKISIGIGGHINDEDFSEVKHLDINNYNTALAREVKEELGFDVDVSQVKTIGIINDDSTEVGQVHLGILHLVEITQDQVSSAEDAIENIEFLTIEQLEENKDNLESWSQFALTAIKEQ